MCGIAGKIYFRKKINKDQEIPLIERTLEKLHHRGPDDRGYVIKDNIWLGATRLSIIDLSPSGHQPMKNEDGSLFLVFNGEIYNYLDLKRQLKIRHKFISKTDSEVILHLYEEQGINCLKYLRGMYAFAIWDQRRRELFLARDRLGKKPLKYYYNHQFFVFASELKAFIDHPDIPKEIDWGAIDEFLTCQYVPSPKTGFKNIWKLPPAHYMTVKSNGEVGIQRYWQLDFSQKPDYSENEWQRFILEKLKESIRLRLQSDVSAGIHLSGGIDSSIITALASMETKKPIKTFSIGFEEKDYNELPYARLVAERYQTDHHEFIVKSDVMEFLPTLVYQYEEPFADPSILPTWCLMKESKKYITVALNGDGGDENFAGYYRYQIMKLFHLIKVIPLKKLLSKSLASLYSCIKSKDIDRISQLLALPYSNYQEFYQEMVSFINTSIKKGLYTDEFKEKIKHSHFSTPSRWPNGFIPGTHPEGLLEGGWSEEQNIGLIDKLLRVDINTYLPDNLLVKVDIASMAHSMEVRSPFLDQEFMELTAKMPSSLKLRYLKTKYLLKIIAQKYLPQQCLEKRKQAFLPPMEKWFRMKLYKYLKVQLLDEQFLRLHLFRKDALEDLIESHYNFHANNAYLLWRLLCLRCWLKEWFKI